MQERTAPIKGSSPSTDVVSGRLAWYRAINVQELGILVIFLAWVIFLSLATDTFLTTRNVFNMLRAFSWIAIAAFGQCMVILTGGIDLSVGSNMALSGLAAAILAVNNVPTPLAILGGILTGGLIGLCNGLLVTRFRLPPFIATLGMLSIARGITYGVTGGWPVRQLPADFNQIGQFDVMIGSWPVPVPVLVMVVLAILVSLFLSRTVTGRHIYAVGGNEEAARVSGIKTQSVKLFVYISCGVLAAIGGILMTARLGVAAPTAAEGYELDIIAAAVIGGVSLFGGEGTILGVLIGAALMQTIRTGLNLLGFPTYWQPAAIGAVILLAVTFDQWRKRRRQSSR
ncbi:MULTISPECIES: ABC transporter permease [Caldilinea]|jgi:ribose transport system permease protein|uniref:Putative ABC transporter permease protein n=1 Tax=Caldilinea aerophila (strain DSM 14535 / JCM 11387 / NBRC 104270 / STL-6-O1) TaxID=926550 RepID=I0I071_CALAS|nr:MULTISPECIES: ABC transporter permease [Caldilinea]MBO9391408.1 ABC transporter permease [Caldilinea sp.]BAL98658.1 putative ABC transporter permease protein [Caldilinea aerophila DSM 14535 = NBRC 104270]GIV74758.1 MAG: sugar ABC transporter permease [Caldilinea sp.]